MKNLFRNSDEKFARFLFENNQLGSCENGIRDEEDSMSALKEEHACIRDIIEKTGEITDEIQLELQNLRQLIEPLELKVLKERQAAARARGKYEKPIEIDWEKIRARQEADEARGAAYPDSSEEKSDTPKSFSETIKYKNAEARIKKAFPDMPNISFSAYKQEDGTIQLSLSSTEYKFHLFEKVNITGSSLESLVEEGINQVKTQQEQPPNKRNLKFFEPGDYSFSLPDGGSLNLSYGEDQVINLSVNGEAYTIKGLQEKKKRNMTVLLTDDGSIFKQKENRDGDMVYLWKPAGADKSIQITPN